MKYDAFVTKENDAFNITFPDAPGCQTFAESAEEVVPMAREALEGWLEANLAERRVPPRPVRREEGAVIDSGARLVHVAVNPRLATGLLVRWAREERDLSQAALAKLVGVTQQAIAKLEDPDANPGLETIEKVAAALGLNPSVDFAEPDEMAHYSVRVDDAAIGSYFTLDEASEVAKGAAVREARHAFVHCNGRPLFSIAPDGTLGRGDARRLPGGAPWLETHPWTGERLSSVLYAGNDNTGYEYVFATVSGAELYCIWKGGQWARIDEKPGERSLFGSPPARMSR